VVFFTSILEIIMSETIPHAKHTQGDINELKACMSKNLGAPVDVVGTNDARNPYDWARDNTHETRPIDAGLIARTKSANVGDHTVIGPSVQSQVVDPCIAAQNARNHAPKP